MDDTDSSTDRAERVYELLRADGCTVRVVQMQQLAGGDVSALGSTPHERPLLEMVERSRPAH